MGFKKSEVRHLASRFITARFRGGDDHDRLRWDERGIRVRGAGIEGNRPSDPPNLVDVGLELGRHAEIRTEWMVSNVRE